MAGMEWGRRQREREPHSLARILAHSNILSFTTRDKEKFKNILAAAGHTPHTRC